jgi:hypothetical protein
MRPSSLSRTLVGVLALGIGGSSALAQNAYSPLVPNPGAIPYAGYNLPGGIQGTTPVPPYGGLRPQPWAYQGGYGANGGGFRPQPGPYPGGYGANPTPLVNPYVSGYPGMASG